VAIRAIVRKAQSFFQLIAAKSLAVARIAGIAPGLGSG
jgi:hypothetical protein